MTEEQQLKHFEEKIEAEIKIEPRDWMPEKYRKNLVRTQAQDHFNGENPR